MRRNRRCRSFVPAAANMDDKTLNLWRQIEGARRIGKRRAIAGSDAPRPPRPHRLPV